MAITVTNEALRTSICDLIVDSLDAGSGAGKFVIHTSGHTLLATVTLNDPAYGSASASVAALSVSPTPSGTAVASGNMDHFHAQDSDSVEKFAGTIGTTGENINFSSVAVTSGVTVIEVTTAPFTVTA